MAWCNKCDPIDGLFVERYTAGTIFFLATAQQLMHKTQEHYDKNSKQLHTWENDIFVFDVVENFADWWEILIFALTVNAGSR
jgi:hypothetical protein